MKRHRTCTVDGCDRWATYRLYCDMHYKRVYKYGNPHTVLASPRPQDFPPTPHDRLPAIFRLGTPEEHERFRQDNTRRIVRQMFQHSPLYLEAHAAETQPRDIAAD